MMDFIEGPFDQTIKTANLPILTSIVGMAYGGDSPFKLRSILLIWQVVYVRSSSLIGLKLLIPIFHTCLYLCR